MIPEGFGTPGHGTEFTTRPWGDLPSSRVRGKSYFLMGAPLPFSNWDIRLQAQVVNPGGFWVEVKLLMVVNSKTLDRK